MTHEKNRENKIWKNDRIFLIQRKVHEWHLFSIRVEHFHLRNNELESLEFHQSVLLIRLLLLSNEIAFSVVVTMKYFAFKEHVKEKSQKAQVWTHKFKAFSI